MKRHYEGGYIMRELIPVSYTHLDVYKRQIKAGAQRIAAELGLALIAPDTSPRGAGVTGETESWDLSLIHI